MTITASTLKGPAGIFATNDFARMNGPLFAAINNCSVEFWVRPTTIGRIFRIGPTTNSSTPGLAVRIDSGGWGLTKRNATASQVSSGPAAVTLGTNYHVVAVFASGVNNQLWVNGVPIVLTHVGAALTGSILVTAADELAIGDPTPIDQPGFAGTLGRVFFWPFAQSATWIQASYRAQADQVAVLGIGSENLRGTPNRGPVAIPMTATVTLPNAVDVDVAARAFDPNGNLLTPSVPVQPTQGTSAIVAGKVRYTPQGGTGGQLHTVPFRVADAALNSSSIIRVAVSGGVVVPPDPPSGRPKNPDTPTATIRVPEDQPTLAAAYSAASAGTHISLADGNHNGITLNKPISATNPIVIKSRNISGSTPGATITGVIDHTGSGHWLYQLRISYRGSSDATSAVRINAGNFNVTRCYFSAPMAIYIPYKVIKNVNIGWNAFRGTNPTSGESVIRVVNSSGSSSPTSSFSNSAIYRNYFKDANPAPGESHTFYIGGDKGGGGGGNGGWMDFYFEENLIDTGDGRLRQVYMKSGCHCIRNTVKKTSPSTGFRHGFGGKFWGNRITGDVMANDGHGATDGQHHDFRDNVWTGDLELHCGSDNGSGSVLHQAASWATLVGNSGSVIVGFLGSGDRLISTNGEEARVHDVKIYDHSGAVSPGSGAGSNNQTNISGRDGGPTIATANWTVTDVGFQLASQAS